MASNVAVVDDHPLIRRGFASAISEESDLEVAWTAKTIADATECFQKAVPDIVVVDLGLDDGGGLDLIRTIRMDHPETKVLVSSMKSEDAYAARCLKAGASGFISKSEPIEKLIAAIGVILDGKVYLSERMTAQMLQNLSSAEGPNGVDKLSDRELQVLELIGVGKETKAIAQSMHISTKTVDSFRERIKSKLKLSNATELIHFAVTRSK